MYWMDFGREKSFEILDAFVDARFDFIDTADMYSYWIDGVQWSVRNHHGKWMKAEQ